MASRSWCIAVVGLAAGSIGCGDLVASADTSTTADGPGATDASSDPDSTGISAGETSAAVTETTATSAVDPSTTAVDPTTTATDATAGSTDETTRAGPACGDGVVDAGEECDEGPANADEAACTWDCEQASCGDGLIYAGVEACDDGVNDGGYGGCLGDCSALAPHCGDGVIQEAHETCEPATLGPFCDYFCGARTCEGLALIAPTAETCPPAAQINAAISGDTPLGPFAGTFAAQSFDYTRWTLVVASAYAQGSLCDQPHLLVDFDEPFAEAPGETAVHVLAVLDGAAALTTGTVDLASNDYTNFDASDTCTGATVLQLTVEGDGWSLSGTVEAGCCWSGDNIFVM
jgi:hypothetical protein